MSSQHEDEMLRRSQESSEAPRMPVGDKDDLAVLSEGIREHSLPLTKCVGCKTTCGLVFDERFNRHVCPNCLIQERNAILRRLAESVVNKPCDHKLVKYDYTRLNQTAVVDDVCTICGQAAETPT